MFLTIFKNEVSFVEIKKVRAKWNEPRGFCMERQDTGDEYIFIQFLSPAQVLLNGKMVDVDVNSCIMYNKHSHQYMTCSEPLAHDWMHITGNLDELTLKYGFKYNTIYKVKNGSAITRIVLELEEEFLIRNEYNKELVELKIEELVLKVMRESSTTGRFSPIKSDTLRNFLLFRLRMSRDYQQQWTVSEMATLLGFSQSRFCTLYKEIFGVSPKRDLQTIRIEQAKNLLICNEYTVNTVALMCGYTNRFHFMRIFKKETGKTPLEYRMSK